jgi:Peptidase inhibitor I9
LSGGYVSIWKKYWLKAGCFVALLLLSGTVTMAQTEGKVPREVIDHAASHGTVLVLVGLNVPWQMESGLSENEARAQREAIASIQKDLLTELEGRSYKVIRRYDRVPGIALEASADVLAQLARSANVTNVLLDRPALDGEGAPSEKVPWQLFKRAASDGTVLVLAGLRTPWQREEQLSEDLKALQRTAILSAQSYVLAELGGTQFKVMRLYRSIPGIALRVGLDALQVLEKSPAVTNVVLDRPVSASR